MERANQLANSNARLEDPLTMDADGEDSIVKDYSDFTYVCMKYPLCPLLILKGDPQFMLVAPASHVSNPETPVEKKGGSPPKIIEISDATPQVKDTEKPETPHVGKKKNFTEEEAKFVRQVCGEKIFNKLNNNLFPNKGAIWNGDNPIGLEAFRTLQPGLWLSDDVINLYLEITRSVKPSMEFYNTAFIFNLLGDPKKDPAFTYDAIVQRYSNKFEGPAGLFQQELIAIPINRGGVHWVLVLVFPKKKAIYYWDSKLWNGKVFVDSVLDYLKREWKRIPGAGELDYGAWKLCYTSPDRTPEQPNNYDCGVYVCSFLDNIRDGRTLPVSE
jgi:Ulp1 family protease